MCGGLIRVEWAVDGMVLGIEGERLTRRRSLNLACLDSSR